MKKVNRKEEKYLDENCTSRSFRELKRSPKEESYCNVAGCDNFGCDKETTSSWDHPPKTSHDCQLLARARSIHELATGLFTQLGLLQGKLYLEVNEDLCNEKSPEGSSTLVRILNDADSLLVYATSRLNELNDHVGD